MLDASRELLKYFHDCRDVLSRILEKQNSMSDELGRDGATVSMLMRKHLNFIQDLQTLQAQVSSIQEDSAKLQAAYAGEKAMEITNREREVVRAWMELQAFGDSRKRKLNDTGDLFKFFAMVRSLMAWMDDLMRQMSTSEKPRDVSGVELLMNNHQGHKAEIDTREDIFGDVFSLGKELLSRSHYASNEIKEKLMELTDKRNGMIHRWEERWEHLQLILEVYQFARDAAVAEAWLIAQDPYLKSEEYGQTIDEVENLIKKHEAFEKAAAAQEERFAALERLTTFELKDMKRRQEEEERKRMEQIEAAKPKSHDVADTSKDTTDTQSLKEQSGLHGQPATPSQSEARTSTMGRQDSAAGSSSKPPASGSGGAKGLSSTLKGRTGSSSGQAAPIRSVPASPHTEGADGELEGMLGRKHAWETTTKKAAHRSWDRVFTVLNENHLNFYKDSKSYRSAPEATYRNESAVDLVGGEAEVAADYTKKKHVFRLKLANGGDYLFQCTDDEEMNMWISAINSRAGGESGPSKSQTLPSGGDRKDEPKRRSFFTLKKK